MVFGQCEGVNAAVMVVDETLLKKMKVDWRLLKTVVFGDQGRHLKVALFLSKQAQDDECEGG